MLHNSWSIEDFMDCMIAQESIHNCLFGSSIYTVLCELIFFASFIFRISTAIKTISLYNFVCCYYYFVMFYTYKLRLFGLSFIDHLCITQLSHIDLSIWIQIQLLKNICSYIDLIAYKSPICWKFHIPELYGSIHLILRE